MSVSEIYSRALPEFLAIGMPYDLFWDGDVWLAQSYIKAHRIRREQENFDKFLQGAYFYEALVRVAPALHAFNSKPKPEPWLDKPYELYPSDRDENMPVEEKAAGGEQGGISFMLSYMAAHNSKHVRTEGEKDTLKKD